MQEEVEQRTLTLVINGTKFSGRVLKSAVSKFVAFTATRRLKDKRPPQGQAVCKAAHTAGPGCEHDGD